MNTTRLEDILARVLDLARQSGASAAEASIGTGAGFSVTARMGEPETVEHQRDKGLNVTCYIDRRKGSASTTDFGDAALRETVQAAVTIARNTGADEFAGLLEPQYLAQQIPDLDLHHPWEMTPERALALAIECETIARSYDLRIVNSEGATVHSYSGSHYYGNSHGFIGGWDWSTHSIDCSVIAEQDGMMQRDGWYSKVRDHADLDAVKMIAETAASRALRKLGARKLPTLSVPVIYESPVAGSLFSSFTNAIMGGAQYRKSSFLLDRAGSRVFPEHITIDERPHLRKGAGSAPFDNEGMATRDRTLVEQGVLQGYVLSAYSARKLGLPPTGNAGGIHNLIVSHGNKDLPALLKTMDKGLLITDLIGFGINQVTGDYSRGASGFWVEQGEIQYPVEEITVAGNLAEMFMQIAEVGNDIDPRRNIQTGSVLIENMTVAGN